MAARVIKLNMPKTPERMINKTKARYLKKSKWL
jgi:hypothetical protein